MGVLENLLQAGISQYSQQHPRYSRKMEGYPVDISLIGLYNLKHRRTGILNPELRRRKPPKQMNLFMEGL